MTTSDSNKKNILILGYGEMGHAMEHLLSSHHDISIWEKFPKEGFKSADLIASASAADVVIFCLPIIAHRQVAKEIVKVIRDRCICLSIAKGIDEEGKNAAQIFEDEFKPKHGYALLYGPMISEEICAGNPSFAALSCKRTNDFNRVAALYSNTNLTVKKTTDLNGISWAVILKNVYAILIGIADGMELGANVRGYLATASLAELDSIVIAMGGEPGTALGFAGLGDLVTTATSRDSHHHELGVQLANGDIDHIDGEGVHTLAMVKKFELLELSNYPLFSLVNNIIEQPGVTRELVKAYFEDFAQM